MAADGRPTPLPAGPALIRVTMQMSDAFAAIAGSLGLSVAQARLLFVLDRHPDNMLGLGRELGLGKSTMTGVVARMESAGWVRREADPADRRRLVVAPTAEGSRLAGAFVAAMRTTVEGLLAGLEGAEREAFAATLSGLLVRIEHEGLLLSE